MSGGTATAAPPRRRTSVRQRLLVVVLVPTVGLLAFGGHSAYRASAEADRAQEVEARVDRAGVLLRLKLLLTNETFSTGGVATAARFGLAPDAMEPLVGFDPVVRMRDDRRAVDRLAASGAGSSAVSGSPASTPQRVSAGSRTVSS